MLSFLTISTSYRGPDIGYQKLIFARAFREYFSEHGTIPPGKKYYGPVPSVLTTPVNYFKKTEEFVDHVPFQQYSYTLPIDPHLKGKHFR